MSGEKVIIEIADLVVEYCREADGRTRAEDAISAAAAGAGEACIAAAGEFDPAVHDFTPGQAFVSDKVNRILVGDGDRWGNLPSHTALGNLQKTLLALGYSLDDAPQLTEIFRKHAASLGKHADGWGWVWVWLSAAPKNRPRIMPLRVAYELRDHVNELYARNGISQADRPLFFTAAMVKVLVMTREVLTAKIALALAGETLIGMSKMFPMTTEHLNSVSSQSNRG